jgi:hypothetical protein
MCIHPVWNWNARLTELNRSIHVRHQVQVTLRTTSARDENRADTVWCHVYLHSLFGSKNKYRNPVNKNRSIYILKTYTDRRRCEHLVMQILAGTKRTLESCKTKTLKHSNKPTKLIPNSSVVLDLQWNMGWSNLEIVLECMKKLHGHQF